MLGRPQRGSQRGHLPPRFSKKGIIGTFLCVLAANLIEGKNTHTLTLGDYIGPKIIIKK